MTETIDWNSVNIDQIRNKLFSIQGKAFLGLDGVVDQVWQIVRERKSQTEFTLFKHLAELGEFIINRQKGGISQETILKRKICGGFTANTGRALGTLGIETHLLGFYGEQLHPAFNKLSNKCQLISIGDPIICNIYEFADGKLMLPNLERLLSIDWQLLRDKLGIKRIKQLLAGASVVSIGYWSNMPNFDSLLEKLYQEILLESPPERLFFDFGNLTKKSKDDYLQTLKLLSTINKKIPVTISLNDPETKTLLSYYDYPYTEDISRNSGYLIQTRNELAIDELVVHTPYWAIAVANEQLALKQDYNENPVITTGAGDSFNGGYIAGYLMGMARTERLAIANAVTSYYVRQGQCPDREGLVQELTRIRKELP